MRRVGAQMKTGPPKAAPFAGRQFDSFARLSYSEISADLSDSLRKMSDNLRELIAETQQSFREQPETALATFESVSLLTDGLRSDVKLRDHRLTVDEPESLGGTDAGPNPVELILASLGSCQEITYKAFAATLGIPIESVSVKLEGDIDLRGFFAVDEGVRPGYQSIKGTVRIVSSASPEALEQLRGIVNTHCPVLDIIKEPVPVELDLEVTSQAAAAAE